MSPDQDLTTRQRNQPHDSKQGRRRRSRQPRSRECLLKGCGRAFRPGHPMARYCARSVGGKRDSGRNGRAGNDGGSRRTGGRSGSNKAFVIENGWGLLDVEHRARKMRRVGHHKPHQLNFFSNTCDRPGCYEGFERNRRSPLQRFCCHGCRRALERALERERRWRERGQGWAQARSLAARSASLRL